MKFESIENLMRVFHPDDVNALVKLDGGISKFEAFVLYAFSRQSTYAIEFSPNIGMSTIAIGLAFKRRGLKGRFATFEIDLRIKEALEANLGRYELSEYVQVIYGDALQEIPRYVEKQGLDGKTDLCFIDSCHSEKFADSYISRIFPLLSPQCVIGVHDIGWEGQTFGETLFPNEDNCGEYKALARYLADGASYVSLHKELGGKREKSVKMHFNEPVLQRIDAALGGIRVPRECSASLWFERIQNAQG